MNRRRSTFYKSSAALRASFILLILALVAFFAHITGNRTSPAMSASESSPAVSTGETSPAVLVELFTSEGCSSCPPADKLLADLDQTQPVQGAQVIALSEHVDYWNRLGWKDPFSSADFTRRQVEYARALGLDDYYTPQMIVDGRFQFVGSRRSSALEAIAEAARSPKASVSIAAKSSGSNSITLIVRVDNVPAISRGDRADVMLAVAESGLLSKVSRGENSGRELAHSSVARKLIKIGTIEEKNFTAESAVHPEALWNRQQLRAIAFVQERASRHVLGAASLKLAGEP